MVGDEEEGRIDPQLTHRLFSRSPTPIAPEEYACPFQPRRTDETSELCIRHAISLSRSLVPPFSPSLSLSLTNEGPSDEHDHTNGPPNLKLPQWKA